LGGRRKGKPCRSKRKAFFFEKKKQKTFTYAVRFRRVRDSTIKSLLLLFFRKEDLSFSPELTIPKREDQPRRHKDTKRNTKKKIIPFSFVIAFVPSCLRG